ncbi:hypothetical protein N7519_006198 [Penicillium mononematosum]|uniref:uncharacterized protein n=1 Tax=Penicillium mononematosum TaxID=268346 RepID=UPI002548657D|nr:uncharacterized protein N7519_006198 [Penicillium mononematosum]KAJ6184897.1 hypothetical protein N7519_006198 [Penicillium mononematosum]
MSMPLHGSSQQPDMQRGQKHRCESHQRTWPVPESQLLTGEMGELPGMNDDISDAASSIVGDNIISPLLNMIATQHLLIPERKSRYSITVMSMQ